MKRNLIFVLAGFLFLAGAVFVSGVVKDDFVAEEIAAEVLEYDAAFWRGIIFSDVEKEVLRYPFDPFLEDFDGLDYSGYIIQFEEKPVIERKIELEDRAKRNEEFFFNRVPGVNIIYNLFVLMPKDVPQRMERYSRNLGNSNTEVKNRIAEVLGREVFVKKLLEEFKIVFNGVALNISDEEAKEIENIKGVKKVWPNMKVEVMLMDSVPLIQEGILAGQLDRNGNNCKETGEECLTGAGIKIAIIDTGVDYTHPDLESCMTQDLPDKCKLIPDSGSGKAYIPRYYFNQTTKTCEQFIWGGIAGVVPFDTLSECENLCLCKKVISGYDFVNRDEDPMDDHGHGTHIAAIAAGNGILKGVAPGAQILSYKVINNKGQGQWDWIISGIEKAVKDGADILSLSFGGSGNPDDPQSQAVDNAVLAGSVVVVTAGNLGPSKNTIMSPGTARKSITVGATNKQDELTLFSSRGPVIWEDEGGNTKYMVKPDILAPGVNICAAQWNNWHDKYHCLDEEHIAISGTSMATSHVSGAVALLLQKNPDWTPDEIKASLKGTAIDLGLSPLEQGAGRINITNVVRTSKFPIAELKTSGVVENLIDIGGSAFGEDFAYYTLEYGRGLNPEYWILLTLSEEPVVNGNLYGKFDTSILESDIYWIRLAVVDNNNIQSVDKSLIINGNERIYSCSTPFECNLYTLIPNSEIFLSNDIHCAKIGKPYETCIRILSDNLSIDCNGHGIHGNYIGFLSQTSKNIEISNCNMHDHQIAFKFLHGSNLRFNNNKIYNAAHGFDFVYYAHSVSLKNNKIYPWFNKNSHGFVTEVSMGFPGCNNVSIDTTNKINDKPIFYFCGLENSKIQNLDAGSILIKGSSNVTLSNISSTTRTSLYFSSNMHILNSTLIPQQKGAYSIIYSSPTSGLNIENNLIKNPGGGGRAIDAAGWSDNLIIRNNIIKDSSINIFYGENVTIKNNTLMINITPSDSPAYDVSAPIKLEFSRQNFHIEDNWIYSENNLALDIKGGFDGKFFHNNILMGNNSYFFIRTLWTLWDEPVNLSFNNRGNFWGRTTLPYFCEYGNQNASCIDNWDSNRPDVIDPCPYNKPHLSGQWPASPVCPSSISKIENLGDEDIEVSVFVNIQKDQAGVWADYKEVINRGYTIFSKGHLDLTELFNIENIIIDDSGNYRVNVIVFRNVSEVPFWEIPVASKVKEFSVD